MPACAGSPWLYQDIPVTDLLAICALAAFSPSLHAVVNDALLSGCRQQGHSYLTDAQWTPAAAACIVDLWLCAVHACTPVLLSEPVLQVFDSAASKGSWAEALGLDEQVQHHQQLPAPVRAPAPAAAGAAAAGSVSEPATPHTDAAVQTDISGPAESAGSTAAAATAVNEGCAASPQQQQHDQQASSRQSPLDGSCDAAASSALLAAARHEILRLQELNRQLMQARAEGVCRVELDSCVTA